MNAATARPLLFLDVDGVLNPFRPPPDGDFAPHPLAGWTVYLSPTHAAWLRELSAVYDPVWCTTWQHDANVCIGPRLGLAPLPVVRLAHPARGAHPADRKWRPLLAHAAGRPFAWLDDLIPPGLLRRTRLRPDRLLLPVDPGAGLLRHHVDRLLHRPPGMPGARLLATAASTRALRPFTPAA